MTPDTKKFTITFDDDEQFECYRLGDTAGNDTWQCKGTVNQVEYTVRLPNVGPTRVFQALLRLWETRA